MGSHLCINACVCTCTCDNVCSPEKVRGRCQPGCAWGVICLLKKHQVFVTALSVLAHIDLSVHFRIMFPTSSPLCHLCSSYCSLRAIKQACNCTPRPPPERFFSSGVTHSSTSVDGRPFSLASQRPDGDRGGGWLCENRAFQDRENTSLPSPNMLCN